MDYSFQNISNLISSICFILIVLYMLVMWRWTVKLQLEIYSLKKETIQWKSTHRKCINNCCVENVLDDIIKYI
jgi:hypothetical protein